VKALIVDDHSLFRAGLRLLIQSVRPDVDVFEASCAEEAVAIARNHPDLRLCLLDIHLSQENGLQSLTKIKASAPEISVVVVSAEESLNTITRSLDAGAMGFIPKRSNPSDLMSALLSVLRGEIYIPKIIQDRVSDRLASPALSPRQWSVFHCVMRGLPNKLICRELTLSENTVKSHMAAIFRAFDVHTRTQLLIAASKMTDLPSPQTQAEVVE
jgi:DNA-binding NarL/FixJ family response regulator